MYQKFLQRSKEIIKEKAATVVQSLLQTFSVSEK